MVSDQSPHTDDWSFLMPLGRIEGFDAEIVQSFLDKQGFTRPQIAAHLGVSASVVSRWLSGVSSPAPARAKALADLLSVDVLEFSGKTMNTADIVDLRQRQGMTTADVAERTDISKQQIYDIEAAITPPSDERLEILVPVYEVTLDQLKKGWVKRRIHRFGTESLKQLPEFRDY